MGRYLVRRASQSVLTIVVIVLAVFFLLHTLGDPVAMMLPTEASQAEYDALMKRYGYDRPLLVQFSDYITSLARGDFGESIKYNKPVIELINVRLPKTLYLAMFSFGLALLGIPLGILAAVRPRSLTDRGISFVAFAFISAPHFWIAIMLILLLAVRFQLLPTSGYGGYTGWKYLIMPAMVLSLDGFARFSQLTRAAMLEELAKQYVVTAHAKGLSKRTVLWVHTLKNAGVTIITLGGDQLAHMVNGSVVMETIFGWPGLGQLIIISITARDLPVVIATFVIVTVMVMFINFVVDMTYAFLDPRIRYG